MKTNGTKQQQQKESMKLYSVTLLDILFYVEKDSMQTVSKRKKTQPIFYFHKNIDVLLKCCIIVSNLFYWSTLLVVFDSFMFSWGHRHHKYWTCFVHSKIYVCVRACACVYWHVHVCTFTVCMCVCVCISTLIYKWNHVERYKMSDCVII